MKKILGIGNALVDVMTFIDDDHILEKFPLPKGSMQLVDQDKSSNYKVGNWKFNRSLASEDQLPIQFMDWQCLVSKPDLSDR